MSPPRILVIRAGSVVEEQVRESLSDARAGRVSGPVERTTRHPGRRYGDLVVAAATALAALTT